MYAAVRDYVILKPDPKKDKIGSIMLPNSMEERTHRGTIVAVGPGVQKPDGSFIPMQVEVGDYVIYGSSADTWIEDGDEKYLVMHQGGVYCKIIED